MDSENYLKIHPLNRAQIIDDSCYMVRTKRLKPTIFLEIIKYLSRETDYIPWYSAFRAFRTFQDYFTFPDSAVFLKVQRYKRRVMILRKYIMMVNYLYNDINSSKLFVFVALRSKIDRWSFTKRGLRRTSGR